MTTIRRAGVLAVAAAVLAGCSSSGHAQTRTTTRPNVTPVAQHSTSASPPPAPQSTTAATGALSGTWHGRYSGGYSGTFTLTWTQTGSALAGSIKLSNPAATLTIHGSLSGTSIRFGTVGAYGITYTGAVNGSTMSGTYQVAGGAGGGSWSASKR